MKKSVIFILISAFIVLISPEAGAQIKVDLKGKINREANRRANKKTQEGVNKGFNKLEEGVKGLVVKKDSTNADENKQEGVNDQVAGNENVAGNASPKIANQEQGPALSWSKYDFVPGDKIIFEDNLISEENGEFPSRWDLVEGTVENAEFGGEMVIMFRGGSPTIVPYLKNSNIDYLPEVFTIEFDLYLPSNTFTVYFYDRKNQKGVSYLSIGTDNMSLGQASSKIPGGKNIAKKWAHIAIAYTDGKLKAYIDDTRLINIPHLEFNPSGLSLHSYHANDNNRSYVKNVRIAEGGVKYYDRFLQDGKIVSNGIRFDVGKASLRPESMGVLNEIYKMLNDHPEVSVSIEGHTDSDGDANLNQKLSEERAETVMNKLISMGINKNKVSYKGFGESKPVNSNDTPEGKASNRRVEFVKN